MNHTFNLPAPKFNTATAGATFVKAQVSKGKQGDVAQFSHYLQAAHGLAKLDAMRKQGDLPKGLSGSPTQKDLGAHVGLKPAMTKRYIQVAKVPAKVVKAYVAQGIDKGLSLLGLLAYAKDGKTETDPVLHTLSVTNAQDGKRYAIKVHASGNVSLPKGTDLKAASELVATFALLVKAGKTPPSDTKPKAKAKAKAKPTKAKPTAKAKATK